VDRALTVAAILIVLAGGYVVFSRFNKAFTPSDTTTIATEEINITTARVQEETDTYRIDAKYPQFGIPTIDERVEEFVQGAITQFKSDVALGPPPPDSVVQQYDFTSLFDTVHVGSDVVSARLVISTYMGGAHPNSFISGLNFERSTGKMLTLNDALSMIGLLLEQVAEKAKEELEVKLGESIIAPEGADATPENYSSFVVGAEDVTFIFQPYQVAPYAAGPQEVSIPRK
jgi:hypothetical protein